MIKIVLQMITLVVQKAIVVVKQGQKLKFLKHVPTTKKMVLKLQLVIEIAKEIVAVHQLIPLFLNQLNLLFLSALLNQLNLQSLNQSLSPVHLKELEFLDNGLKMENIMNFWKREKLTVWCTEFTDGSIVKT